MRSGRVFAELVAGLVTSGAPGDASSLAALAATCVTVSGWGQASIVLRRNGQATAAAQGGSSPTADDAADVEQRHGQGPTWDALAGDRPVFVPDLSQDGRWPQVTPALAASDIRAVSAMPLGVGALTVGTVTLYDDLERHLDDGEIDALLELSEALTHVLLGLQAQAADGSLAVPLDAAVDLRAVVHQATGMVAIQLGSGLAEALLRLRAYAYTHDQVLADVAEAVVGRALRFEP